MKGEFEVYLDLDINRIKEEMRVVGGWGKFSFFFFLGEFELLYFLIGL